MQKLCVPFSVNTHRYRMRQPLIKGFVYTVYSQTNLVNSFCYLLTTLEQCSRYTNLDENIDNLRKYKSST